MPNEIEPRTRRPATRIAPLLLVMSLMMPFAATADPLCQMPVDVAPKAAPIGLDTSGNDLHVELVTDPTLTHVVIGLAHDQQASIFTTPATVDSDGRVTATLYGALQGADTRAIGYHLSVTDLGGTPLMAPYPLSIIIECPGADASYSLVPGVSTTGLLLTRALANALDARSSCEVPSHALQLLDHPDPAVCAAARTLLHQLDLMDIESNSLGPTCRHEWQAVVPRIQNAWILTQETETAGDPSVTVGQVGGLDSGAASCFALQGTSLAGSPFEGAVRFPHQYLDLQTSLNVRGATQVEQSVLCLVGGTACEGGCAGTVAIGLDTAGCVSTRALSCDGASQASSTAAHTWRFTVDGLSIPMGESIASIATATTGGNVDTTFAGSGHSIEPLERPAPIQVRIEGEATLGVGATSPIQDATSFGFAEANTTYTLMLEASGATCTESANVRTIATTPALPEARLEGGLKMKRWWPDGESNTWFADGWPEPEPPKVCEGIDLPY